LKLEPNLDPEPDTLSEPQDQGLNIIKIYTCPVCYRVASKSRKNTIHTLKSVLVPFVIG